MIENMYGSIHTHFEDSYDAVNDIKQSILQFILQGAVKVAATGHGVFTEFEDIQDAIAEARAKSDEVKKVLSDAGYKLSLTRTEEGRLTPRLIDPSSSEVIMYASNEEIKSFVSSIGITDHLTQEDNEAILKHPNLAATYVAMVDEFEVIPGIEAYFEKDKAHMILIAKDYEGYSSLSKIISQSSEDYNEVPIVTLDSLEKNVDKGHLYCTSACIAGVFGKPLALRAYNLEQKIENLQTLLNEVDFDKRRESLEEQKIYKKTKKATKAEETKAERLIKKENDYSLKEEVDQKNAEYAYAQEQLALNAEKYIVAERVCKANNRRFNQLLSYQEELDNINIIKEDTREDLKDLYYNLESIFGKENFFFEIQNHGLESEKKVYNEIIKFAYEVDNPNFIASNDIHVCVAKGTTEEEHQILEDALIKRNVAKFGRFNKYQDPTEDDKEYYIKTDAELRDALADMVDENVCLDCSKDQLIATSLSNVENVLSDCHVDFPEHQEHYPKFCDDENQMFDDLVEQGVKERFPNGLPEGYRERIDYEKDVIKKMGYAGYHLIVQDYLNYGKLLGYLTEEEIKDAPLSIDELKVYVKEKHPEGNLGIGIGPGRGSAGGSLCCYLLGITDVDPIKHGLLFERFLNVERVSMPDIDSDFRSDVRDKTYEYCKNKYGQDRVCKVLTKTYLAEKGAIKTSARYLGDKEASKVKQSFDEYIASKTMTPAEIKEKKALIKSESDGISHEYLSLSTQLCKKYDELSRNVNTSAEEIDQSLREAFSSNKKCMDILNLAKKVENMFTVYGKHAAGVIISKDPIRDVIPIMYDEKDDVFKTQCVPSQAEAKGLLKMDFLGLTNLAIITNIIRTKGKEDYNLQSPESIARILNNKEIYAKIFATGLTHGVFQFESPGMKKMLKDFKPESFEDIVLLVAAYRPGPMDYIPEIIAQKWHRKNPKKYPEPERSITLKNDALERILEPTYGCPIYQEQIMRIFQDMAGYSLGGADVVRRYMSKKKVAKLAHEKHTFIYGDPDRGIPGCIAKHGITEKEADDLFEQMMPFAKYGFNKSHAVEYAIVSMYTAYLKYAHTADFYRCSMDAMDNIEKLVPYIKEAKEFGIQILPPNIYKSENKFRVEPDNENVLFYGFSSVKGIGSLDITHRTEDVYEFIKDNPNISIKDIQRLADIGLFKTFFAGVKTPLVNEKKVVNKADISHLIEDLGSDLRNYFKMLKDQKELESVLNELPDGSEEKAVTQASFDNLNDKIKTFRTSFGTLCNEYASKAYSLKDQPNKEEDNVTLLKNEEEYLGYRFSIKDLIKRFDTLDQDELHYGGTFADLPKKGESKDQKDNGTCIPVVIVDGGENNIGKTKTNNQFHTVKLMDKDGNFIDRRYKNAISEKVGWLNVYGEDSRYFVNKSAIESAPSYIKNKVKAKSQSLTVNLPKIDSKTIELQNRVIDYLTAEGQSMDDDVDDYYTDYDDEERD